MRPILLVACVLPVFTLHAQNRLAARQADALRAQLETAQAEGIAAAVRPGDENLTCDELQAEVVAVAQSPEILAALAPFGDQAQAGLEQIEDAQQELEEQTRAPRSGRARSMAQSLATAALPNSIGAAAQQAAAMAQAAQMQAQAAQFQQQLFGQAPQFVAVMGPAMRGQRVMELAEAKKCEWLKGDPLSTPPVTTELPPIPVPR